jgi:hypothetical protein
MCRWVVWEVRSEQEIHTQYLLIPVIPVSPGELWDTVSSLCGVRELDHGYPTLSAAPLHTRGPRSSGQRQLSGGMVTVVREGLWGHTQPVLPLA